LVGRVRRPRCRRTVSSPPLKPSGPRSPRPRPRPPTGTRLPPSPLAIPARGRPGRAAGRASGTGGRVTADGGCAGRAAREGPGAPPRCPCLRPAPSHDCSPGAPTPTAPQPTMAKSPQPGPSGPVCLLHVPTDLNRVKFYWVTEKGARNGPRGRGLLWEWPVHGSKSPTRWATPIAPEPDSRGLGGIRSTLVSRDVVVSAFGRPRE
jgi:hypothetical protein